MTAPDDKKLRKLERDRKSSAKYRKNNKEKIKQYLDESKDKINKRMRQYRRDNWDRWNVITHKRRAKMRELVATFTYEQWLEVKDHFNNQCAYCGESKPLTQDHFVPVRLDGGYALGNIIPSCLSCNSSKRASLFTEWYPNFKHYSKDREQFILEYIKSF